MDNVSGKSGDCLPVMKRILGCMLVITGVLLAFVLNLIIDSIPRLSDGVQIIVILCCVFTGGLAMLLYPVISKFHVREIALTLVTLFVIPILLLALGIPSIVSSVIPFGDLMIVLVIICVMAIVLVSWVQSQLSHGIPGIRPVFLHAAISVAVIGISIGSGVTMSILVMVLSENPVLVFLHLLLQAGYLLISAIPVFIILTGFFTIVRYVDHNSIEAEHED